MAAGEMKERSCFKKTPAHVRIARRGELNGTAFNGSDSECSQELAVIAFAETDRETERAREREREGGRDALAREKS